jgi:hypothetical protein
MNLLAIDLSATKPGWAFFEGDQLKGFGTLHTEVKPQDFGAYPFSYPKFARHVGCRVAGLVGEKRPEQVVLEETTPGSQTYSQKQLEMVHAAFLEEVEKLGIPVSYIRTGTWRKCVGCYQNSEEKRLNAKIGRMKAKSGDKAKPVKIDGKVVGKKTKKHVSLRRFQEIFGIELKLKDNDAAEAALLGKAFLMGAPVADGTEFGGLYPKEKA